MNRKSVQLPRTPLQFYVKLYCKSKGISSPESRNAVVEATKSWLSLSAQEKLKITNKFKDSNANYKNKFANYLKSAEPYLKKKKCKWEPKSNNKIQEVVHSNKLVDTELTQSLPFQTIQECPTPNDTISRIPTDIGDSKTKYEVTSNQEQPSVLEQQTISKPDISEPTPPNISNAQQLHEIIKESGETTSNWSSLTKLEKNRYQKAVLILKKEYINKYKDYLESLPMKDLFNYYNKNINMYVFLSFILQL